MNTPFWFLKADTPELLKGVFQLRYEVYCHECNFLDPDNYPNGLEMDEYDPYSIHFAALDHENTVIGTIRLIKNVESIPYPIEIHCKPIIEKNGLIRSRLAEISRLAVSKKYRRRDNDDLSGMVSSSTDEKNDPVSKVVELREYRRRRPEIVLGLYKLLYHESKRLQLTHWVAAMERTLWQVLNRFGIQFQQVGDEVNYYGPVIPYCGCIADLEKHVYQVNPELYYKYFLNGLEPSFWPEFMKTSKSNYFRSEVQAF